MQNTMVQTTYTDEKTAAYYAWRASNYDPLAEWEQEYHNEAVQLSEAREGQHILVVACGTGRGMIELAQAVGPNGKVEALDLSAAMIEKARAKSGNLGLSDRINFRTGNARQLPYADNSFDIVYNGYMFDLIELEGFEPILKEMARVLKPGGRIVLLNMSKQDGRKTFYEKIYKYTGIPCRPVLMAPYLEAMNFKEVKRIYRAVRPRSFYERIISFLWGQEIVVGRKV